jgi:hypothetical protein
MAVLRRTRPRYRPIRSVKTFRLQRGVVVRVVYYIPADITPVIYLFNLLLLNWSYVPQRF